MTRQRKQTLWLAYISQSLCIGGLYALLAQEVFPILGAAVLLVAHEMRTGAVRQRHTFVAGLLLVLWMGIWSVWQGIPPVLDLLLYSVLGLLLQKRMEGLQFLSARHMRGQLKDEFLWDVLLFIVTVVLGFIYMADVEPVRGLPWLLAYMGTRLLTLLACTRLMSAEESSLSDVGWKGGFSPLIWIVGTVLGVWILQVSDIPGWDSLLNLLLQLVTILFYGVGWILQWIGVDQWNLGEKLDDLLQGGASQDSLDTGSHLTEGVGASSGGGWIGMGLVGLLVILTVWLLLRLRRKREGAIWRDQGSGKEIRRFLSRERVSTAPSWPYPEGSITWVRRGYRRFLSMMRKAGYPRKWDETPTAYARRLKQSHPEREELISRITRTYQEHRYGNKDVDHLKKEMSTWVKQMERKS